MTRKRFSACWGSLHSVPVRAKPRFTEPRAPPIPIKRCLRHRAAASPFHSTGRLLCARFGCFNGSSCQNFGKHASQVFLIVAAFAKVSSKLELWLIARAKAGVNHHPGFKKHLLVLAASTLFVVLVYTLFPVCAQRGTAPDRADCFADHNSTRFLRCRTDS